jgi:hypothetical protein
MTLTVSAGPESYTNHVDLVIVHNGVEFRAINTDPGIVFSSVSKKQFIRE